MTGQGRDALPVFYADRWVAVCQKPAGTDSQGTGPADLPALLSRQLGGPAFPVHRLDRETAGLMVFARTSAAAAALSRDIQAGRLEKGYLALLSGSPPEEGVLTDYLFKDSRRGKVYPVSRPRKGVREARLAFRTLWRQDGGALVWAALNTGRTHQIRVHLSHLGFPLCGDFLYGRELPGLEGFALHSCGLSLAQPVTGEALAFSLPDPPAFARLLKGGFSR